jgi:hypothetical protein
MIDRTYGSYRGYHWFVRCSAPSSIYWALLEFFRTLVGWRFWNTVELELRTRPKYQGRCYCPTGSTTEFRFHAAGWLVWICLSRFTGSIPCPCDIGMHEYHVEQGEDCGCIVADQEGWYGSVISLN